MSAYGHNLANALGAIVLMAGAIGLLTVWMVQRASDVARRPVRAVRGRRRRSLERWLGAALAIVIAPGARIAAPSREVAARSQRSWRSIRDCVVK